MARMDIGDMTARLTREAFPRSARWSAEWLLDNMMGPCSVWLTEALTDVMPLDSGGRVLDLGCGKAMSSMFLAHEFGVEVDAVDLWIDADSNRRRIDELGLGGRVHPRQADVSQLTLTDSSLDAIVSIDAYHYLGTRPGVLGRLVTSLKPGGRIGVVVPGLRDESLGWPTDLAPYWQDGFETFHSPDWWRDLWEREGVVRVDRADALTWGGSADWLAWSEATDDWARLNGRQPYELETQMLRTDADGQLVFVRLVATRL